MLLHNSQNVIQLDSMFINGQHIKHTYLYTMFIFMVLVAPAFK